MIKRKIAMFFMLLASIMMLANTTIIHHHHNETGIGSSHSEESDIRDNHLHCDEQGLPINLHTDHSSHCHSYFSSSSEFYFTPQNHSNVIKKIHFLNTAFFNITNEFEFFIRHESKKDNLELGFLISFQYPFKSLPLRGPPIV